MKCDELRPLIFSITDLAYVEEIRATNNFKNPHDHAVYKATEVDASIDELKREHHRERHEYIEMAAQLNAEINRKEAVGKRWFERCMEARAENVRLKRALWLMTAEWAEAMELASCNIANKFMSRENFEVGDNYRNNTVKKYRHRQVAFYKYADYCRKKAEKYK